MKRTTQLLMVLLLLVAGFGCGGGGGGGGGGDGATPTTTQPTVLLQSPNANATGVAVTTAVAATFSEEMDPATLTGATFTLRGPSGAVAGTVSCAGGTVTFTPSANLAYGATYTVTIAGTVTDLARNPLGVDYTWSFTTAAVSGADYTDPYTGMQFTYVPPGSFTMGDEFGDGSGGELPTHTVRISQGFYLGTYEVTQAQWQAVMGTNPSSFTACGADCPVEEVSWNDIQTFLAELNTRTGQTYRLPTEAEWEYAAKGGPNGGDGTQYAGSDDVNAVAWYSGNSGSTTHPVGTKAPNGLGLYDLSGNVWEWVQDWYGSYTAAAVTDPTGPATGSYRVFRGGGWHFYAFFARVSYRYSYFPGFRDDYFGFRLALSQ